MLLINILQPNKHVMKLCCVFTALLSVTALNYLLSLVSLVMFYIYYTRSDGCTENKVFISINMLLCIAASVMSILPQIQVNTTDGRRQFSTLRLWVDFAYLISVKESQPRSGLLQSSLVTLYTMYLTWSAMTNEPGKIRMQSHNPVREEVVRP